MKYKILFIDDEDKILKAIERVFINTNYELLFAKNGKEGIELLQKNNPAVIVTDLRMPEMGGIEFLHNIKSIKPNSMRIVLSALSDKDNVLKASKSGDIWKYIVKPWNDDELIKTISNAITEYEIKCGKEENNTRIWIEGKKVFFINPHNIIKEKIIIDLILNGFEVYLIENYIKSINILRKFNNSILFINVDNVLNDDINGKIIQNIMNNKSTENMKIGVLTYFDDKRIKEKYQDINKIHYGVIQLKSGLEETKNILLNILNNDNVKGSRNSIRIPCIDKNNVSFNFIFEGKQHNGSILNISSEAMACKIENTSSLVSGQLLKDIQLVLRGHLALVDGSIGFIKENENDEKIYIIKFKQSLNKKFRENICKFIHLELQDSINNF